MFLQSLLSSSYQIFFSPTPPDLSNGSYDVKVSLCRMTIHWSKETPTYLNVVGRPCYPLTHRPGDPRPLPSVRFLSSTSSCVGLTLRTVFRPRFIFDTIPFSISLLVHLPDVPSLSLIVWDDTRFVTRSLKWFQSKKFKVLMGHSIHTEG